MQMVYPLTPEGKPFDPAEWEKVAERREPARGRKYRGGESCEEVYRHRRTGKLITRHYIIRSGRIVHDHFRPGGLRP
jgi:hypothetical protein